MYCLVRGGALVWRFWVSEGFWSPTEVFSKGEMGAAVLSGVDIGRGLGHAYLL